MRQGGCQVAESRDPVAFPHADESPRGPAAGGRQSPGGITEAFGRDGDVVLMLVHRGVEPGQQWLDVIARIRVCLVITTMNVTHSRVSNALTARAAGGGGASVPLVVTECET